MSVPKIDVASTFADKFAQDLEKLNLDAAYKTVPKTDLQIPAFQRQGFMEKLGHTRKKWFKRFFVLRDSFLLGYNLEKSELTVEPRSCVALGHSKIQELEHPTKCCFMITTSNKEEYEFAVASPEERAAWMKDLQIARMVTHGNMVKLAVENQCIADEKGLTQAVRDKSTSSLSIFANQDYIRQTPMVGGSEGWLFTPGFNVISARSGGVFSSKVKWFKGYVVLRDSHLMMFRSGDTMAKPRGCMYLVGTSIETLETNEKNLFGLCVKSAHCGDLIELGADSDAARTRWMNAIKIGTRVTYRDFKMLLKEHELLSSAKPPAPEGSAAPAEPAKEASAEPAAPAPVPVFQDEVDILGKQLDPGAVQPYTADGHPILKDPDGKWIDSKDGREVDPKAPKFSQTGQELDPFNRPLPPGAQAMFSKDGMPIGVGVDGNHYMQNGTEVAPTDPHYDRDGNQLPQPVVDAAQQIVSSLNVAIKVRAHLQSDGQTTEAVDNLGRTFRDMKPDKENMIINADGQKVPMKTARVMDPENKKFTDFETHRQKETKTHRDQGTVPFHERKGQLAIVVEDEEGGPKEIGKIDVEDGMVMADLRPVIEEKMVNADFVFLANSLPLSENEEKNKYALSGGDKVIIRPRNEFSAMTAKEASAKAEKMSAYELEKKRERDEFDRILKQVQTGTYLKPVKKEMPPE
jgi:hypothetical protein